MGLFRKQMRIVGIRLVITIEEEIGSIPEVLSYDRHLEEERLLREVGQQLIRGAKGGIVWNSRVVPERPAYWDLRRSDIWREKD